MVGIDAFAACISDYISSVVAEIDQMALLEQLQEPTQAIAIHESPFRAALVAAGIDSDELKHATRDQPYLHLQKIFDPDGLPETPKRWFPVPNTNGTLAARLAILLVNCVVDMETVSYGSENDGELFVNLVALEGNGIMADKSVAQMKGHTDAASFPFRGTFDQNYPRIAPSPDLVFLAALRNPDLVPTVVMPLACTLAELSDEHAQILKGPSLVVRAQRSFVRGTESALGEVHMLDGTNVLFDSPEGTWVRYTHSQSTVHDQSDEVAIAAKEKFEAACLSCAEKVVLSPGDLLVVNNRKALHGRAPVTPGIGGSTRWLLRSYGLDTSGLKEDQRHPSSRYKLYP
jgi:hypothetical protein